MISLCLVIQLGMRVTPLCSCLRFIVNEKSLNLENTTFSVLPVLLLIYVQRFLDIFIIPPWIWNGKEKGWD